MRYLSLVLFCFVIALFLSSVPRRAHGQEGVAAIQSEMYAALRQVHFAADLTPGVGPIDSSQAIMTVNVRNDSNHQLIIGAVSVTFRISGQVTAWPSINGVCSIEDSPEPMYRMLFRIPEGRGLTMMFPSPGCHIIEPHTTGRIDIFAEIQGAPQGVTVANATTLAQVDFRLGPWQSVVCPDIHGRSWRLP